MPVTKEIMTEMEITRKVTKEIEIDVDKTQLICSRTWWLRTRTNSTKL